MKKILLLFVLLFSLATSYGCLAQTPVAFNFDFEKVTDGMPAGWVTFGDDGYAAGVDDRNPHGGTYSVFIESKPDGSGGFKAWCFTIPGSYKGREITLAGYLRTEQVEGGYAGLWMRIDPDVAFDNMSKRGVTGTTDWSRFEITLPLNPSRMERTVVGGLLVGAGKMWIDDLSVSIDGKPIDALTAVVTKHEEYPAQQDHAFDDGSGITSVPLDAGHVRTLAELGQIWGFLKYYHPAVAAGNYNWDYELFRILPEVLAARDRVRRDSVLTRWIEGLGVVKTQTASERVEGKVMLRPDLDWIGTSGFSDELVGVLMRVKQAWRKDEHYYIGLAPYVGNPEFKHEVPYASMLYPDAGYRILALYCYWNMIQYFFPNIHLIGEDWKGVLEEFVPRFAGARDQTDYLLASLEIIARIHDTHANLWMHSPQLEAYKGRNCAAVEVAFVEQQAVVTGFRDRGAAAGLRIGDVIAEVDGRPVEKIVAERLTRTPASNYPTQLRNIAADLLRTNDTTLRIACLRDGVRSEVVLGAYAPGKFAPSSEVPAFKMLPGQIAYLYPASLAKGEIEKLWDEIKDARGLIVDLRCYPSDFIVFSLGSRLVGRSTPFVMFTTGSIRTPGLFVSNTTLNMPARSAAGYKGRVVILVNEQTQSQAEYTAMALRIAPRAVVVGSTTAGADGNVSEIVLPGGVRTMISGIGILYPDGRETQRVGIVPDVELRPTIRGIAAGRDELMEKAVELIGE